MSDFRSSAPSADVVMLRTYSRRKKNGEREKFSEAITRTIDDIASIGKFSEDQYNLVKEQALCQHAFPSGRAFWVAGTDWSKKPKNFPGYFNCTNFHINDLNSFGFLVDLAMQGCGTGAILEQSVIKGLPFFKNKINLRRINPVGKKGGDPTTSLHKEGKTAILIVGDSREGWVKAYLSVLELAAYGNDGEIDLTIDLGNVRPAGKVLKGFGGTANPIKLEEMFRKIINIVNQANNRKPTSIECCLLIDEAAACVVAGNIRRSAGMRMFSQNDDDSINAKLNLYSKDSEGNWYVDPAKESLRMANHTRCFHTKPTLEELRQAVRLQYDSGEGAVQYAPEAIARANADLLDTPAAKARFLNIYNNSSREAARSYLEASAKAKKIKLQVGELTHRMNRYGLNPCAEIIGCDFFCNLGEVHLNTLDPFDKDAQIKAFQAASLQVASLLNLEFANERYNYSRRLDPIVGVSFTGLFDFFVHAFGAEWLAWMMEGRPDTEIGLQFIKEEIAYLDLWKTTAFDTVKDYCNEHNLRCPNRVTTVQPAGTKSLLTGASSGWHPPKAQRFIRRITLGKSDPLVPSLIEYGYNVIPAQSAKDENGRLLNDIKDSRVQEVLVEIPTEVSWANIPGCDKFDLSKLPITAQWGLYMNVQNFYTQHNTSATLEIYENEIDLLAELIHDNIHINGGYISAAILARFESIETFPRLPFEPISKEEYEIQILPRKIIAETDSRSLADILKKYDSKEWTLDSIDGCTSAACIAKAEKDELEKNL